MTSSNERVRARTERSESEAVVPMKDCIGYWLWKRALARPWEVPEGCFHFLQQALEVLPDDEAVPEEPSLAWSCDE